MGLDFDHYRLILFGGHFLSFILEICLFLLISNRILTELMGKLFEINQLHNQKEILSFYGININLFSSRRFRFSMIFQLAFTAWIGFLLLIDGCVFHVARLSSNDSCPSSMSDCFLLETSREYPKVSCAPNEIFSNSTSINAICFVFIYNEQDTLSVLNQLGVCSSVSSLFCYVFKIACRMSRKRWGLTLLVLLLLGSSAFVITAFIIVKMNISAPTKLILIGLCCLLINVIQLLQFTHSYKRKNRVQATNFLTKICF
ncbi:unnamed protein product [Adineta ricciae]|uniref:Uncharacterized protein n=1 Tax=Adineta ricciae TaxID=249248 RepID=A0A816C5C2_ADIRI|nr:unnamed protein product [Adineta ricciae]CAF1618528.1 unnamed protein product [Adineta ricciae]